MAINTVYLPTRNENYVTENDLQCLNNFNNVAEILNYLNN